MEEKRQQIIAIIQQANERVIDLIYNILIRI